MKRHSRALVLFILPWLCLAPRAARAQADYRIGVQDVLTITVFGESDLTGKYTVEGDGTFLFPLIGRVKAAASTQRELEAELKKRLADGYLKNPQITIAIESGRSQRIFVLGEVKAPGEYPLAGDMSLLAALARAGSTTQMAGREAVIVRQSHKTGEPNEAADVIKVDLVALQEGNLALNIPLQDGDTVNVPKAQSVYVSGQVKAPGAYPVDPGTTVLQVLSLAGGVTDRGADNRIKIQRIVKGKRAEVKGKLTDAVQPGDTIIVPEKFF